MLSTLVLFLCVLVLVYDVHEPLWSVLAQRPSPAPRRRRLQQQQQHYSPVAMVSSIKHTQQPPRSPWTDRFLEHHHYGPLHARSLPVAGSRATAATTAIVSYGIQASGGGTGSSSHHWRPLAMPPRIPR